MSIIDSIMEAMNPGTGGKRYYIRFGKIPPTERSRIHSGGDVIGEEIGVSCYDAAYIDGEWRIVYPNPCKECTVDTLHGFILGCCGVNKFEDNDAYLITGDKVGYGSDGEPLIRNVRVIANITDQFKYIKPVKTDVALVQTESIWETTDKDKIAKAIYKMRMKRDAYYKDMDDEVSQLVDRYVELYKNDIGYDPNRGINRAPIMKELDDRITRVLEEKEDE